MNVYHLEDELLRGSEQHLKNFHLACCVRINALTAQGNRERALRMAYDQALRSMSQAIIQKAMRTKDSVDENEEYLDVKVDLYVFTPGELHRIINDQVRKIIDMRSALGGM